jgi:hypothetical protein
VPESTLCQKNLYDLEVTFQPCRQPDSGGRRARQLGEVIYIAMSDAQKRMNINHEETKNTKKVRKSLRVLRFFVVDFRRK